MSTRYDDRDYERRWQDYRRRSESDYGRSYDEPSRRNYGYRDESERQEIESRWRGDYGSGSPYSPSREYQSGREEYSTSDWGRGREAGRHYGETSGGGYRQRYNYPTGFRSGETERTYGEGGRGYQDYGRRYGRGEGRDYDYERGRYGPAEDRGWWDRASDEVASWFGDEEAMRRRRLDERREEYRGRGPKNYHRSDERINEDVNDRLSEGYLDASDIEVKVENSEVTLTGTVNSRLDKRRAEDLAESVSGVTNVENRLRVKQGETESYTGAESTLTTGTQTGTSRAKTAGT